MSVMKSSRVILLALVAACTGKGVMGGGGTQSDLDCDHTQTDSTCCLVPGDCMEGECAQPGTPAECGACDTTPGNCTLDSDCTLPQICEPIACSCSAQMQCVPGCVNDSTCDPGQSCDLSSNRCQPKPCTGDTDCPTDFRCPDSKCSRQSCTDNTQCDDNSVCVEGTCFGMAGECRLPTP